MSNEQIVEVWQQVPLPGMEDVYASNLGRIRRNERILSQQVRKHRRNYLGLSIKKKTYLAHRIICMAFHGLPPTPKAEVMHLDNNVQNNVPDNLRWGTHAENMAMDRGNNHSHKGESNKNSKLTAENVREIREAYDNRKPRTNWGCKKFADRFNLSEQQIGRIARREKGGWVHV